MSLNRSALYGDLYGTIYIAAGNTAYNLFKKHVTGTIGGSIIVFDLVVKRMVLAAGSSDSSRSRQQKQQQAAAAGSSKQQ